MRKGKKMRSEEEIREVISFNKVKIKQQEARFILFQDGMQILQHRVMIKALEWVLNEQKEGK